MTDLYRLVDGGYLEDDSEYRVKGGRVRFDGFVEKVEPDIVRILIHDAEAAYRDFEMAMDRILAVFGRNNDS